MNANHSMIVVLEYQSYHEIVAFVENQQSILASLIPRIRDKINEINELQQFYHSTPEFPTVHTPIRWETHQATSIMPRNSSSVNFSPKSRAMRFRFLDRKISNMQVIMRFPAGNLGSFLGLRGRNSLYKMRYLSIG